MQYSEKDLANLIASVEKEFMADLTKHEEALAKSETAEAAAPAAEPQAEAKVEETKTEESLAKSEEAKEEKDHKEEDCDYDEKDVEEMHKMYKSMSKKELEYHKAAIEKCGEMSMTKSEEKVETEAKVEVKVESAPNPELELLKSETATLKAENESLKKNLDALVAGLDKFVKRSAPQGKAITEVAALAKSEGGSDEGKSLSKSEVTAILAKKAADPSLSKSDRALINEFYLNSASIETVSHLLK